MAIFSSNQSFELYLPKFLGPYDFLPFFLMNVFQKKILLLREGLQKNYVFKQDSAFSYVGLLLAPAKGSDQKGLSSVCAYFKPFSGVQ